MGLQWGSPCFGMEMVCQGEEPHAQISFDSPKDALDLHGVLGTLRGQDPHGGSSVEGHAFVLLGGGGHGLKAVLKIIIQKDWIECVLVA